MFPYEINEIKALEEKTPLDRCYEYLISNKATLPLPAGNNFIYLFMKEFINFINKKVGSSDDAWVNNEGKITTILKRALEMFPNIWQKLTYVFATASEVSVQLAWANYHHC